MAGQYTEGFEEIKHINLILNICLLLISLTFCFCLQLKIIELEKKQNFLNKNEQKYTDAS